MKRQMVKQQVVEQQVVEQNVVQGRATGLRADHHRSGEPAPARAGRSLRRLAVGLLVLGAVGGSACNRGERTGPKRVGETHLTEDEKAQVVAQVGDTTFTLEDVEQRINQQSPFARSRYESLARKKEFLDSMVRFELLAADARAKGYDRDPDVVLARKQAMVQKLTAQELANLVKPEDITEADILAHYEANAASFDQPAEARAAHLLVADEAEARRLLAEINAAIEADLAAGAVAGAGADAGAGARTPADRRRASALHRFSEAAKAHSTDARTAPSGGDLGHFGQPGQSRVERQPFEPVVPPAVASAAFAVAEVGGIVPEPVRSSQGWHLVQRTGERKAFRRSLDEVRTRIRNTLYRSRKALAAEKYVADLRAAAKVEIDEAVLDRVKVAPAGAFDPRIVPGPMREALGAPGPIVRPGPPGFPPPGAPLAPTEAPDREAAP